MVSQLGIENNFWIFWFLFRVYVYFICHLNIIYSFRGGEIGPGRGEGGFSWLHHQVRSSGAWHPRRGVNRGLHHGPVAPQQQPVEPGRRSGTLPEERSGASRPAPLWCCHSRRPGGHQIPRSDQILVHTGVYLFTWDSMMEVLQFWQQYIDLHNIQRRHLLQNWQQLFSQQTYTCDPTLCIKKDTYLLWCVPFF